MSWILSKLPRRVPEDDLLERWTPSLNAYIHRSALLSGGGRRGGRRASLSYLRASGAVDYVLFPRSAMRARNPWSTWFFVWEDRDHVIAGRGGASV